MSMHGEKQPPFLRDYKRSDFLNALGVKKVIELDIKGDGYLLRGKDYFVIALKRSLGKVRKRTIIAHELGHIFLWNLNYDKGFYSFGWNNLKSDWKCIEGPAYEIGRQILVPMQSLSDSIRESQTLKFFNELKKQYETSKEIMAFRLIHDLQLWDVYLFFTHYDSKSKQIILPANHERFKGKTFKYFSLTQNWSPIVDALREGLETPNKYHFCKVKIKGKYYSIESCTKEDGKRIACLIKIV